MTTRRHTLAAVVPLMVGLALLAITLARTDLRSMLDRLRGIGVVLPLALLPGAAWHLLRTAAWCRCFPAGTPLSFARAFRLRLAAEAFGFVTISGFGGDPLKVVLLHGEVPAPTAAAAVALERILYLATTMTIVSAAAALAAILLPFSRAWFSVYVAVALFPLAVALVAAVVIGRRRARPAAPVRDAADLSRVRRFLRDLDANLRHAVQSDPRRIATVCLLEAAAYGTMVLEVWLALRLTHTPVTWTAAAAVETFTRVASMAAAFIPAGIGALEASNVAGAAAVHVAAGGLALALIRRVRGLVWCAAGFLVYPPRLRRPADGETHEPDRGRDHAGDGQAPVAIVLDTGAEIRPSDVLGGLPIGERIARAAARAGYARLLVWSPREKATWKRVARRTASQLAVDPVATAREWQGRVAMLAPASAVTVIAPGLVPSPALLKSAQLIHPAHAHTLWEVPAGASQSTGVYAALPGRLESAEDLAAALDISIAAPPLTLNVRTRADLASAEASLRRSIFKPTDGLLASFNRRLSIPISVACIRLARLNANVMSVLIIALGCWSGWLFSRGDYVGGLLAALVSWAASVLDGCDGELARLQFTESAFGCWVDTFGDYTYYVAIFAGLTVGSARATGWNGFWWIGAALAVGLLLTFTLLVLLRGRITAGRPERLNQNAKAHFYGSGKRWQWLVAKLSNCATRATMPYGIVMFAVANLLPVVLVLAALGAQIYWISLAVELRRLLAAAPAARVAAGSVSV